jgi:hypothetical protein
MAAAGRLMKKPGQAYGEQIGQVWPGKNNGWDIMKVRICQWHLMPADNLPNILNVLFDNETCLKSGDKPRGRPT